MSNTGFKVGAISQNDLMHKLAKAKKVMNKVDNGDFSRGNIDESMLTSDGTEQMMMGEQMLMNEPRPNPTRQMPVPSVDRINQSKLPVAIKRAMIENPIPQISLNDSIDMDMFAGAKKLMEREGMISKPAKAKPQQREYITESVNTKGISSDLITQLTPIIENTIRKVLDEKLNQILTAQQTTSINENLVLKVGDSIFRGKITGVNKSK
jgi:hypothetical protein